MLREKLGRVRPASLAVLGVTAYRVAFGTRTAGVGPQATVDGTQVWVLPNRVA
ncbi:hypothetical protein AB0H43_23325 [Hamadaea sp. NPDC050747]|uniref:hypothetical protein n=1 Tax=Hamadaea sp. NPDC050747 TaxID=3155789 RepID=UPI0033CA203B